MPPPDPGLPGAAPNAADFLRKLGVAVAGIAALALGIVFSAVFFVAAIAVGAAAWGYLAWRTRALRRELRARASEAAERGPPGEPARGRVYEGEAVAVRDEPC